ncbi:MAG: carboxypeptidase regulatory-like domain-containing protein [Bacteroidales bacterium]|nr:carboxypeptidase regulatory-like domain-containing protein [Bacteroidales bacterium]
MKKLFMMFLVAIITLQSGYSQRIYAPENLRNKAVINKTATAETENLSPAIIQNANSLKYADYVGETIYDLQSNASCQNRIHLYPDGTIGATFTYGMFDPSFSDRGTGYNYFDGSDWDAPPTSRIETVRTGWPSYMPWGTNGELVVAHTTNSLVISKRSNKGAGNWTESSVNPPAGATGLLWPRASTCGTNHNTLHLIALTTPVDNGGTLYQGQDGALVYSRSQDGGNTWDIQHIILPGAGSADYSGIRADSYEIYGKDNTVAILVGEDWQELALFKSIDNGTNWTKTVIWDHPYPQWDPNNQYVTDTFYCADGAHSLAIDNTGKIHVAFGINRAYSDGDIVYWFPLVDGLAYWNEDMPAFTNNPNALSPYGDPGTELVEDYNLVGWMQDINGNGTLDIMGDVGLYFVGTSSMPQLIVDNANNLFLFYSSITETYNNGIQDYRHIWARGFQNATTSWSDFFDLNDELIYIFSECVFPSCSPTSDGNIHMIFQEDSEPGLAVRGDEDPYGLNNMLYLLTDMDIFFNVTSEGYLEGYITDQNTGSPLQGALVEVQGTALSATSSSTGFYFIDDIPEGTYWVSCSRPGYIEESVLVNIYEGQTTSHSFTLEPVSVPLEGAIGMTWYDLQTNSSEPGRIYKYPDGTIGATFIYSINANFSDRGTGYNYFDGTNWDPQPTTTVEPYRAGWPSYVPWGANGEMVVSHYSGTSLDGLSINTRPNKGSGSWNSSNYIGPTVDAYYLWPRAATGGVDHNDLHVIALTAPVSNGGVVYQGMDGALLYSRSSDGGQTWDHEHVLLDGIDADDYVGFSGDSYDIIARDNLVAFLVGDDWTDLVLMKSTDNGDNWTKTVIWEHPYPLFDPNNAIVTDTFYCSDGSHSLAFDNTGRVHVAFGINRAMSDGISMSWFPLVDGVAYWNEDMPTFSDNLNALNPYGGVGTELIQDYNLIGWSQDLNNNGVLDILGDQGLYYVGFSSMPQLVIDEMNNVFLLYSSVTEGYDNGLQNYRHIWARGSNNGGQTWGDFVDLNADLIYYFSECVFPSCSPSSDDYIHLLFMEDNEPGLHVRGDEDPITDNYFQYVPVLKSDLIPVVSGGMLEGIVTDATGGGAIEGATVSLSGTSITGTSLANGQYFINNIAPGDYTAVCSRMGYLNASETVTISAGNATTQDFSLTQATGLMPPTNLTATVLEQNNVTLDWDPPASGSPNNYKVYRNDNFLGYTSLTTFEDMELEPGTYNYYVTAVYNTGESDASNIEQVIIQETLYPPENLTALVTGNNVGLHWDAPSGGFMEWIRWDLGVNNGNGIGLTSGGTFYVASHWLPEDLVDYNGLQITEISFFPNEYTDAEFEIMIWTGANAQTLVLSQPVNSYTVDQFNQVELDNPVIIDASEELWFGYAVTHDVGTFPAGCDDGPSVYSKGDMISNDAITWSPLTDISPSLDYNWNLAAFVEGGKSLSSITKPVPKTIPDFPSQPQFVSAKEMGISSPSAVFKQKGTKDLLYYNIYRDGDLIGNAFSTFYTDFNLAPGTYDYCIKAMYDEGESSCSNIATVTIDEPCGQPENLAAVPVNPYQFELTWDPPLVGTTLGFNVHLNGNLVGFITNGTMITDSLTPGITYEYCVTTVCENGESNPSCINIYIPSMLEPPVDLTADIILPDIHLNWGQPAGNACNGYKIYYSLNNAGFNQLAYATNTSFIHLNATGNGTKHEYFVTAMYDEGESGSTDTVLILIDNIEHLLAGNINVYPNPADHKVNVESMDIIRSIEMYNSLGENVYNASPGEKNYFIDINGFQKGLYLLRINTDSGKYKKRLIIR